MVNPHYVNKSHQIMILYTFQLVNEIIKKRIHTFKTQTMEVINEYDHQNLVIKVDCSKTPYETFNSIKYLFIPNSK